MRKALRAEVSGFDRLPVQAVLEGPYGERRVTPRAATRNRVAILLPNGVDAVAMHARTAKQMYRGRADWERIGELVDALRIPVLGNGDVETAEDAVRMRRTTGCAGVLIGRASMKNPWIYRQASDLLAGRRPVEPTLEERRVLIREHVALVLAEEDPKTALHKIRTFTAWYSRGFPEGRGLRVRIPTLGSVDAFVEAIEAFFRERSEAA